jgi:micrococcal nuclease
MVFTQNRGKTILIALVIFLGLLCVFMGYLLWRDDVVVSVPDGDSINLADGRRVRLLGIDAPERGNCMADEARDLLSELSLGRHVRLKDTVKDSYGRILANVIVDEPPDRWLRYMKNRFIAKEEGYIPTAYVNRVLVAEGLARYEYIKSPYQKLLSESLAIARSEKLGIWSPTCRPTFPTDPDCWIKGNVRAGKKWYYLPQCQTYDQVLIDTAYGERWFCTVAEAESAGFVNAETCKK